MSMWGGRFLGDADENAFRLNASLQVDRRMADQDVRASIAWAGALMPVGILTPVEAESIQSGLLQIGEEFSEGTFEFQPADEDIHSAVERRLEELIGPLAGKLHTGRSRNDQVATDFRLWLLDFYPRLMAALQEMQSALVYRAQADLQYPMPGYTHFQRAQPISLGHWWLAHFWPLQRDRDRLVDLAGRTAVLPLGSGALAGAPFPVDRHSLAETLEFSTPAPNSIDSVSDRDFAAEFLFCGAVIGVHLSRLAEAIVLYSSREFGYFELDDAYSTGSSLMPQKKNPDHFELARGKAGTLIGKLAGFLATLKGLPGAYDKDLQEDKGVVFETADILMATLPVLSAALRTLKVDPVRMRAAIDPEMFATDLADYLVRKGTPFRKSHALVGQAVLLAHQKKVPLSGLSLSEYHAIDPGFDSDLYDAFDIEASIDRREAFGGTAFVRVREQLALAEASLSE